MELGFNTADGKYTFTQWTEKGTLAIRATSTPFFCEVDDRRFDPIFGTTHTEDGNYQFFHSNGMLHREFTMKHQQYDGEYLEYHPNGQSMSKRYFESGKPIGCWKQFDNKGKLVGKVKHRNYLPKGYWINEEGQKEIVK